MPVRPADWARMDRRIYMRRFGAKDIFCRDLLLSPLRRRGSLLAVRGGHALPFQRVDVYFRAARPRVRVEFQMAHTWLCVDIRRGIRIILNAWLSSLCPRRQRVASILYSLMITKQCSVRVSVRGLGGAHSIYSVGSRRSATGVSSTTARKRTEVN
ncbi:hypothetical protein C8R44DRAFT_886441 [Mycena epipterygia]|nr:hypothetical protein C8R44DRAFT_886441 [Mycena epipterygia]